MSGWPAGYDRLVLPQVTSTLDEAVRLAETRPCPFWVMAHRQTAARGRRGRPWIMPPGNFAATLMLRPGGSPAEWALRSFVMSLALFQSFDDVTGRPEAFSVKWPNDVLLNGGKVAGILLESNGGGQLSIGVGVNLMAAPGPQEIEEGAVRPVSLFDMLGTTVAPEDFLEVLAARYADAESQFATWGFDPIRKAWCAKAAKLGEVITARTSRDTFTGTFEDVDGDGHLVLRGAQGIRTIAAADVFF